MTSQEQLDFNPAEWLGFSINVLSPNTPSPFSVTSLQEPGVMLLQDARRAVHMSSQTKKVTWQTFNSFWQVPSNVVVNTDDRSFDGDLKTFTSGDEVVREMSADLSFSAEYMGVSVSGGVSYATSSSFKSEKQYAFLTKNIAGYTARISDYDTFVNDKMIKAAIALPNWDMTNKDVVSKYTNFFHTYGTHTIVQTRYGWKYELQCDQSNSSSEETSSFKTNISVKYMGSSVDADYKTSSTYKSFDTEAHVAVNAIGGDPSKAALVQENPTDLVKKQNWLDEAGTKTDEGIVGVAISPISSVFDNLTDNEESQFSHLSQQLGTALFDLQSACRRRITMRGPVLSPDTANATSLNLWEGLQVRILSTNGAFSPPDPSAGGVKDRTIATSTSKGALREFAGNSNAVLMTGFMVDIQSDRTPTIKLAVQSNGWDRGYPVLLNSPYNFTVERIDASGGNQLVISEKVPWGPGNLQFGANTVELSLKPEMDFWWQ